MCYAKIVVKDNYEKRGDLVLRSYIRAIKKLKVNALLSNDLTSNIEKAFIYGEVRDNEFHELLTDKVIDYKYYEKIPDNEIEIVRCLPIPKLYQMKKVFDHVLFGKNNDLDIEVSTDEELAGDRIVELHAYDNFLSNINPFKRLSEANNGESYNAYNEFLYKIKMVSKIRELDSIPYVDDEYEVKEYQQRPEIDTSKIFKIGSYVKK